MDGLPARVAEWLRDLTYGEKALAWLRIDAGLNLTGTGGDLDNHGLMDLRPDEPAAEQIFWLEGMLPPAEAYEFVPSMELSNGRVADLHFWLDRGTTWIALLDVTAERDASRRMQQKAYDMTLLREREALLNRRLEEANAALVAARDAIQEELRRKQLELDEARTLQLSLVPPPYRGIVAGCTISVDVVLEPAKEVGGDLVDHFFVDDDLLVLVLGDVSGKGAGAALFMARTHALLRGMAARPDAARLFRAPEQAVRLVNDALSANNASCTFVTLFLAVFDARTHLLTYVRAGHVPPFLLRANGGVERLMAAGGLPPGMMEGVAHRSAVVELAVGDALLIVTDGVTEAMDPEQALFGEERVEAIAGGRVAGDRTMLDGLLAEVHGFEGGGEQSDDIGVVLLTLTGNAPGTF